MRISHIFLAFAAFSPMCWPQTAEITPAAGVVHEGIPPVPASLAAETRIYRTVPGSSLMGWDPEKPQMVVSGWVADTRGASRVENPGQAPVFFLKLPDWYKEISYDPRGRFFIYSKPADDNFEYQLYRYDINSKTVTLLTDGKSKNRYPIFSNSGNLLAFSSNRRDQKDTEIYAMDPLEPKNSRMIAKLEGENWAVFDWSPDDCRVILSDWRSPDESYLWVLDIETGRKTLLTPPTGREKTFNGSYAYFQKDGQGIYFVTDRDSEFRRLTALDFATGHYDFLTDHIKWDVDEFALSPDRRVLAFVSNEDGIGRLHLMDAATHKEIPVPEMPVGVISGLMWHKRLPYLGFESTSTRFPSDAFSVNLETGKLERWSKAYNPIKTDGFREAELIRWKSFDGRMISGFLYRPPESFTGKRPVIIDIHGGLTRQFRPDYRGEDNYFINALGIARIYPNIRGTAGYGKTFMKLDYQFLRVDSIKDIGTLLDWIAKQPDLDADRVLVVGASSGGYVALSVAAMYPGRISGVISYIAPTNLATFIERNSENEPDVFRREFGDERDQRVRKFMEKIAPVNRADKIEKPCFLIIGGKDLMTSAAETERIAAVLRKRGVPVWYLLASDEAHGFRNIWTYNYTFNAEALFIKNYLFGATK
jgi:dipeptidyl aminopeptidase/acylaminoacyl peptidase